MGKIKRLIYLGTTKDQTGNQHRMVMLTNLAGLIGGLSYIGFAINYAILDLTVFLPIILYNTLFGLLLFVTVFFNAKKRYVLASFWANILTGYPVFAILWFYLGKDIGNHYLFVVFAILPLVTIYNRSKRCMMFFSVSNILFLLLMLNRVPPNSLAAYIPENIIKVTYYFSLIFSLALMIILFLLYTLQIDRYEKDLLEKSNNLQLLYEEVSRLAREDPLTGAFNRRKMDELIQAETTRSERYKTFFSMIIFDLDDFKEVNDRFGHDVGDGVLKQLIDVVRSDLRSVDAVGRWGGEEFVILLPGIKIHQAVYVAQRVLKKIDKTEFSGGIHITASFGVAQRMSGESFENFYRRLDQAMYKAKSNGKNQVCF
jgi:diguanylate cyclase (GGDEF)-like protein